MTTLARYAGPLRAWIGAIGHAADGGVAIAGRLRRGRAVAPIYLVMRDGEPVAEWHSWRQAADALACCLERWDVGAAAFVRQAAPSPDGVELVTGGRVYRLTVA